MLLIIRGELSTCHGPVPPGDDQGVFSIRGCTPGRVCRWKSPYVSPGSPGEGRTGLWAPCQMSSLFSILSPEDEAMMEKGPRTAVSSISSHFTNVETEALRMGGAWPRSHGLFVAEPGFRLQLGFFVVLSGAEHSWRKHRGVCVCVCVCVCDASLLSRSSHKKPNFIVENAEHCCGILDAALAKVRSVCPLRMRLSWEEAVNALLPGTTGRASGPAPALPPIP